MKKIIYLLDPQCGWCYGNGSNISAVYEKFKSEVAFEFLTGGMWTGEDAPIGGASLSQFMQTNGPRLTATTGAPLSDAFYELAKDETYTFSSYEASAAFVLVKELSIENALIFIEKIHYAQFVEGKRLDDKETYHQILEELKIDIIAFDEKWLSEDNKKSTEAEFIIAQDLTSGYPTLVLQDGEKYTRISSGYFQKDEMIEQLEQLLNR